MRSRWRLEYTTMRSIRDDRRSARISAIFFLTVRMWTIMMWREPPRPASRVIAANGMPTCSPSVNTTS